MKITSILLIYLQSNEGKLCQFSKLAAQVFNTKYSIWINLKVNIYLFRLKH